MRNVRVFLSYRRIDSADAAKSVAESLADAFGDESIFLDTEDISAGSDFALTLLQALRACNVLIVLIGPRWSTLRDEAGERRIDDPMDYVQLEIAEALSRALPIIPVLVAGASMPAEADLPEKIRRFHRSQALALRTATHAEDVGVLVNRVRTVLAEAEADKTQHTGGTSVRDYFDVILPYQLRARSKRASALAAEVHGIVQFNIDGDEGGNWALVLDESGPRVLAGTQSRPDLVVNFSHEAMKSALTGHFDARSAVAAGEISLSGNLKLLPQVAAYVFGAQ